MHHLRPDSGPTGVRAAGHGMQSGDLSCRRSGLPYRSELIRGARVSDGKVAAVESMSATLAPFTDDRKHTFTSRGPIELPSLFQSFDALSAHEDAELSAAFHRDWQYDHILPCAGP